MLVSIQGASRSSMAAPISTETGNNDICARSSSAR